MQVKFGSHVSDMWFQTATAECNLRTGQSTAGWGWQSPAILEKSGQRSGGDLITDGVCNVDKSLD